MLLPMRRLLLVMLALSWSATAHASPNAWAFDFDPNISEDPTYVNARLQELQAGLPGLPTNAGIVELPSGQVKLYFFDEVADMLTRARDSGPGKLPTIVRESTLCVEHGRFQAPDLLTSSNILCELSAQAVMAPFEQTKIKTCSYVEFPESYVYDHSPIGFVDIPMVSNWNTLISLVGEALTYVDYPEGLLPADFLEVTRNVLAKLRYPQLKGQIAAQKKAYQDAMAKVQADIGCYDQAKVVTFISSVTAMIAELDAVEKQLDAIYQAGLVEAAADRKAVENQGRIRPDLPHPALSDRDRELLAMYIGGITWRIRGSGLLNVPDDSGSGLYRRYLYVQFPYQLIGELAGGLQDARDVGFQIFIDENWGYAEWFDMGTTPGGRDKYADLVEMTQRGKRATSLVAPTLHSRGYDTRPLVAGGLQMGLCYYYIWEELNEFVGGHVTGFFLGEDLDDKALYPSHVMRFLEWPTATGEMCTGAALSLGLVRTFLWGKPGGSVCSPDCSARPCGADDGCGTPCASGCASMDGGVPMDGPHPDAPAGQPAFNEAGVQLDSSVSKKSPPPPSSGCSLHARDHGQDWTGALVLLLLVALLALGRARRMADL